MVESSAVSCLAFAVKHGTATDILVAKMLANEVVEMVLVPAVVEEHHIYQVLATLREPSMVVLPRSSDQTASVEAVAEHLL